MRAWHSVPQGAKTAKRGRHPLLRGQAEALRTGPPAHCSGSLYRRGFYPKDRTPVASLGMFYPSRNSHYSSKISQALGAEFWLSAHKRVFHPVSHLPNPRYVAMSMLRFRRRLIPRNSILHKTRPFLGLRGCQRDIAITGRGCPGMAMSGAGARVGPRNATYE